jgi:gas vesicle protein
MSDRDNTDIWTAVAIGAVVGIGTALIVRARQEDDTQELLKRLQPVRRRAGKAARAMRKDLHRRTKRAGETAGELVSTSRDTLEELRKGAAEIVRDTRDELQKAARDSARELRRASRKMARRVTG